MKWGDLPFVLVGAALAADQAAAFFRARRTGVTYTGFAEKTPVFKTKSPNLFRRNVWSKGIMAVVLGLIAIFLVVMDLNVK